MRSDQEETDSRIVLYLHHAENLRFKSPDSESQEWLRTDDGVVEPVWSIGPILPSSLIKLLDICDTENDNDENDCTDDEPNLEEDVEINYVDMLTEDDYQTLLIF